MPPVIVAAGLAAGGSILGGVLSSNAAKSAAKTQAQSSANQITALQDNQRYITGLEQPTIDRANGAGSLYGDFLGLGGGDASKAALDTYRGSTGYQDLLKQGLGAVNANAYASGLGQSGATLKALQTRGMNIADQSSGQWLGGLNNLMQQGQQGIGNISGVATNTTNNINAANQNVADATGNAALTSGSAWSKALQGLFNAGSYAYGSSYGQPGLSTKPTYVSQPQYTPNYGFG